MPSSYHPEHANTLQTLRDPHAMPSTPQNHQYRSAFFGSFTNRNTVSSTTRIQLEMATTTMMMRLSLLFVFLLLFVLPSTVSGGGGTSGTPGNNNVATTTSQDQKHHHDDHDDTIVVTDPTVAATAGGTSSGGDRRSSTSNGPSVVVIGMCVRHHLSPSPISSSLCPSHTLSNLLYQNLLPLSLSISLSYTPLSSLLHPSII